jgi:UDP-N-acetylmuramate dehydrogenase
MFQPKLERPLAGNVLLAPHTTWKVGGAARFLAEPTAGELPSLLGWARKESLPVYVLGRGSNVLVADEGLPGLTVLIRNNLQQFSRSGDFIVAGAGAFLPRLARFAASEGLLGFEFLVGIPGTVGGALAMNAGLSAFRPREMRDIVEDFTVLTPEGEEGTVTMAEVTATYRQTDIQRRSLIITGARFRISGMAEPASIQRDLLEHLEERKRKQPLNKMTAGSVFKSPAVGPSAGHLIEKAGLKGAREGGAQVSEKHANWIENTGAATATQIRRLIDRIQDEVHSRLGVILEPEVRFLS